MNHRGESDAENRASVWESAFVLLTTASELALLGPETPFVHADSRSCILRVLCDIAALAVESSDRVWRLLQPAATALQRLPASLQPSLPRTLRAMGLHVQRGVPGSGAAAAAIASLHDEAKRWRNHLLSQQDIPPQEWGKVPEPVPVTPPSSSGLSSSTVPSAFAPARPASTDALWAEWALGWGRHVQAEGSEAFAAPSDGTMTRPLCSPLEPDAVEEDTSFHRHRGTATGDALVGVLDREQQRWLRQTAEASPDVDQLTAAVQATAVHLGTHVNWIEQLASVGSHSMSWHGGDPRSQWQRPMLRVVLLQSDARQAQLSLRRLMCAYAVGLRKIALAQHHCGRSGGIAEDLVHRMWRAFVACDVWVVEPSPEAPERPPERLRQFFGSGRLVRDGSAQGSHEEAWGIPIESGHGDEGWSDRRDGNVQALDTAGSRAILRHQSVFWNMAYGYEPVAVAKTGPLAEADDNTSGVCCGCFPWSKSPARRSQTEDNDDTYDKPEDERRQSSVTVHVRPSSSRAPLFKDQGASFSPPPPTRLGPDGTFHRLASDATDEPPTGLSLASRDREALRRRESEPRQRASSQTTEQRRWVTLVTGLEHVGTIFRRLRAAEAALESTMGRWCAELGRNHADILLLVEGGAADSSIYVSGPHHPQSDTGGAAALTLADANETSNADGHNPTMNGSVAVSRQLPADTVFQLSRACVRSFLQRPREAATPRPTAADDPSARSRPHSNANPPSSRRDSFSGRVGPSAPTPARAPHHTGPAAMLGLPLGTVQSAPIWRTRATDRIRAVCRAVLSPAFRWGKNLASPVDETFTASIVAGIVHAWMGHVVRHKHSIPAMGVVQLAADLAFLRVWMLSGGPLRLKAPSEDGPGAATQDQWEAPASAAECLAVATSAVGRDSSDGGPDLEFTVPPRLAAVEVSLPLWRRAHFVLALLWSGRETNTALQRALGLGVPGKSDRSSVASNQVVPFTDSLHDPAAKPMASVPEFARGGVGGPLEAEAGVPDAHDWQSRRSFHEDKDWIAWVGRARSAGGDPTQPWVADPQWNLGTESESRQS